MLPSDYSLITMLRIKKYFVSFVSFAKVRCFRLLLVALFAQSQLSLSISSIDCQRLLCHPLPWDAFPTSIMEHLSIFCASLHVILPQGSKSLLGKLKWIWGLNSYWSWSPADKSPVNSLAFFFPLPCNSSTSGCQQEVPNVFKQMWVANNEVYDHF